MTLSTPVKIVALAGLALALGAGALLVLVGRHTTPKAAAIPPAVVKVVHITSRPVHPAKPKLVLDPNLPTPVHTGLENSREVVAFVYSPASVVDRSMLAAVRGGAHDAHVGFVALNVQNEAIAASVFAWVDSTADPAVMIVRRPGKAVVTIEGPTDRDTVAQAAANAR